MVILSQALSHPHPPRSPSSRSIPANAFAGLTKLVSLQLDSNTIYTPKHSPLPASAFAGLVALTDLKLGNNNIQALEAGSFTAMRPSLQSLSLNDNWLTTLPDQAFTGLTKLTSLWLQRNVLTVLPLNAFKDLSNLKVLALQVRRTSYTCLVPLVPLVSLVPCSSTPKTD